MWRAVIPPAREWYPPLHGSVDDVCRSRRSSRDGPSDRRKHNRFARLEGERPPVRRRLSTGLVEKRVRDSASGLEPCADELDEVLQLRVVAVFDLQVALVDRVDHRRVVTPAEARPDLRQRRFGEAARQIAMYLARVG